MPAPRPPQSVLIVGAGEFGSTSALSLAEGAYKGYEGLITVVERGAEPPALDAASSDYNKVSRRRTAYLDLEVEISRANLALLRDALARQIVRSEYSDPLYAKLAREAIDEWESNPRWKPHYHGVGVIALSAKSDPQTNYVQGAYEFNTRELGKDMCECREDGKMKELYPNNVSTGSFEGDWGVSSTFTFSICLRESAAHV
jgi:sarcosine oxidase/L-pipecolate oxidase